ncbi:zinc finger CCCH domain-containing protein 41-like isoform X2 [Solanum pennellii]|uniref:Zinc finger CCCH domain-containing protein 41-like isoform X2 n=1 Tax=Solanum pennellii TaxID=28526 RepID=A0ABM1G3Z3_SOLPN|nr:zinc finger CCCH domain-containing protein 41-like isoform X2 [Solanum pennellii]
MANVDVLKEYFSTFGDLLSVELEDLEPQDCHNGSEVLNTSARVSFRSRRSAERAYLNGKCWQDQTLHFTWLQSSNSAKDIGVGENVTPASKVVWLVSRKEAGQGIVNLKIKKEEKKNEDPSKAQFCIWLTIGSIRLIMMKFEFQSCTASMQDLK